MHAKKCIGRAAIQSSCLTYTAWVETLYTGIGRTVILFFPCAAESHRILVEVYGEYAPAE